MVSNMVFECGALTSRVSLLIVIWSLRYPLLSFYGWSKGHWICLLPFFALYAQVIISWVSVCTETGYSVNIKCNTPNASWWLKKLIFAICSAGIVLQDPVLPGDSPLSPPPPKASSAIFEDEEKSKVGKDLEVFQTGGISLTLDSFKCL